MAEVGKSTGKTTQAGREVYETPSGEMVSEKSTTFKYKGQWINVPTIHKGYAYDEDILRMMLDAEVIEPTSAHKSKTDAVKAAKERSETLKFNEGGDVSTQTEEALGWTAEGKKFADANPVEVPEEEQTSAMSIANVPFFNRPMDSSESDRWTGVVDEAGNKEFRTVLGGTYFVKPDPDQRTGREKIEQDIVPVVKNYLENPTAPSREQTVDFLKQSLGDAWETVSIPGDLLSGKRGLGEVTFGDVFSLAGGTGAASTVAKVPDGDSSNTMRMFGGVGMKDAGTGGGFKKAQKLLKQSSKIDSDTLKEGAIDFNTNKKIWEKTNWYVDPNDGQWRFYIDDSKSTVKSFEDIFKQNKELGRLQVTLDEFKEVTSKYTEGTRTKLGEFFEHKELFKRYPTLKNLNVEFYNDPTGRESGSATKELGLVSINLANTKTTEAFRSVLLHEIQHIVQAREDFVPGSNSENIPKALLDKKEIELDKKRKPLEDVKMRLENDLNSTERSLSRRLEEIETPIKGLTKKQEIEIFRRRTQVSGSSGLTGPSWASIGRDYGVSSGQVQKAWARQNGVSNFTKERTRLNKEILKTTIRMLEIDEEILGADLEFYFGAGGEIESRVVQSMAEVGARKFPVEARAEMLQGEKTNYQYRGRDGVDPFVYQNQPRKEPDKVPFLNRLRGYVTGKQDFTQEFAQGGVVNEMDKQMNLFARGGLGDDGMTRDPVSGNEIPPGSMAEEVRDDIPAQLSEGEYVVPADVVRFFGVKYFEDLRTEAKMGLSNMEANGRIGGEPVEPQMAQAGDPSEITDEDLAQLEQMLSTGVANGGLMDKLVFAAKNDQVINQRLNAGGVVVGYAGGGQVSAPTASYADPNRVDAVINQVMAAIQQKPELLQELSKRGIQVSRTNPNMQPQQMDQANPPQEATSSFAEGGYSSSAPGLPSWATTLGGSYMQPAGSVLPPVPAVAPVVGTAPPAASTGPSSVAESCAAMGMDFDPITGTCVLKSTDNNTSGEGGMAPPEPVEFEFKEPDTNYFEMSKEQLLAIGTGSEVDPFVNKGIAALGVVSPPLGAIFGAFNNIKQGQTIAEIRTAALVAQSKGFKDEAEALNKQADKLIGNANFLVQGANSFGGLSGHNDFAQQLAAFSGQGVKITPEMFGDNEKAYKRALEALETRKSAVQTVASKKLAVEAAQQQQAPSAAQAQAAGIYTGSNDDNWDTFGPAVTGTTNITDSDGSTRTVATYDSEKVREIAKEKGAPGGKYKGGLMKKRRK